MRSDLFKRGVDEALITDFFGGVAQVQVDATDDASRRPYAGVDLNEGNTLVAAAPYLLVETKQPESLLRRVQTWSALCIVGFVYMMCFRLDSKL